MLFAHKFFIFIFNIYIYIESGVSVFGPANFCSLNSASFFFFFKNYLIHLKIVIFINFPYFG